MKKYLILLTVFVLSLLLILIVSCSGPKTPAPIVESTLEQTSHPTDSVVTAPVTNSPATTMLETAPLTDAVTTAQPETTAPETPHVTPYDRYVANRLSEDAPYAVYYDLFQGSADPILVGKTVREEQRNKKANQPGKPL